MPSSAVPTCISVACEQDGKQFRRARNRRIRRTRQSGAFGPTGSRVVGKSRSWKKPAVTNIDNYDLIGPLLHEAKLPHPPVN